MTGAGRRRPISTAAIAVIAGLITSGPAQAQRPRKEPYPPYFQQYVHYRMEISLDPEAHLLTAHTRLTYRNRSPDTLTDLYFHLYTNAYRPNSVMARQERKFFNPRIQNLGTQEMGFLRVSNVQVAGARVEPEWPLAPDSTLFRLPLPRPLAPDAEVVVELDWVEQLSTYVDRAGRDDRIPQYDFAQWYPKPVVWDRRSHEANAWVNAIPFYWQGEFYGEFGTFDVTIEVPDGWTVAATGVPVEGDPGWEGARASPSVTVTYQRDWYGTTLGAGSSGGLASGSDGARRRVRFHAEDVHDFAWSTSPRYVYEEMEWNGRIVRSFYRDAPRDRATWATVNAERGVRALAWLSEIYGLYPYPQVTILHGLLRGGMEYPMLVMDATPSEGLIVHELGHIYSYGIWGNNEWLEAWLDEGMTTFQTRWYLETRYGPLGFDTAGRDPRPGRDWLSRLLGPRHARPLDARERVDLEVLPVMLSGLDEPISTPANDFRDGAAYGVNAYPKGSLVFETLRHVVGEGTFRKILHEYFDRYHFRHVTESGFRRVAEEVSGRDLGWFFDLWLRSVPVFDYRLGDVSVRRGPSGYTAVVEVERLRDRMPVDVEVRARDGSVQRSRVEGGTMRESLTFRTAAEPVAVTVDPDNEILEWNRADNVWSRRRALRVGIDWPGYRPVSRDRFWLRGRPSVAYNEKDRLRLGTAWRGDLQRFVPLWSELHLSVGLESGEVDGAVRWREVLLPDHPKWILAWDAGKLEGRTGGALSLSYAWQPYLQRPPYHRLTFGMAVLSVTDLGYLDGRLWQDADVGVGHARYGVDFRGQRWGGSLSLDARWGFDFATVRGFGLGSAELQWRFPARGGSGAFFRAFGGLSTSRTPVQERFFAAGASPREEYRYATLRSRGSAFTRLDYHLPGGANVRGLGGAIHAGREPEDDVAWLAALNAEVRRAFRLPGALRALAPSGHVALFADFGSFVPVLREPPVPPGGPSSGTEVVLRGRDLYADAGVGLRFSRRINDRRYLLRVDFPIWVSEAALARGDEGFDFRYVLSLELPW